MQHGAVLAGRFEVVALAGEGGMGAVYRALDRETGVPVALKVLRADTGEHAERFVREAQLLAGLQHDGIVRRIDDGVTDGGQRWLALEWLEGEDLQARLAAGPLSVDDTLALARAVAAALGAAHAVGVVHRDIKPSNLFLLGGEPARVKLLDFGIARLRHGRDPTLTGTVLGTPAYMAPEQARGGRHIDARADVFSLGCVLYECLTGRPAFSGETVMAVLAKILLDDVWPVSSLVPVPRGLDRLISRALSKDPAGRPADAQAFSAELSLIGEAAADETSVLTAREQRVLTLVLVRGGDDDPNAETMSAGTTPTPAHVSPIAQAAVAHGARVDRLADGTWVASFASGGVPTDLAAQGARLALALAVDAPVAVVTGQGVVSGRGAAPVGEAVDRAARLLSGARAGIRIDEATAGLLDARFVVGGAGEWLELTGEREAAEEARFVLGKETPFIGRERELATLREFVDESARDSVARAVLVTAPPGMGKSRLRRELVRALDGVQIWSGRADLMRAGSPYDLIGSALRRDAGLAAGDSEPVRRAKLRARVARNLAPEAALRAAPFLGELVGGRFADDDDAPLRAARRDPVLMGDRVRAALCDYLLAECRARPVVLLLDDVHWGDQPTMALLDELLRLAADERFVVIAFGRPEVHDVFPGLWRARGVQELRLGELSRRASERLVRHVLADSVNDPRVAAMVAQAGGNAYFLEELIRGVAEGCAEVPSSVVAMTEARLGALEPEARRVLRAASVLGEVFQRGALAALLGGDPGAWLVELERRELICSRECADEELAFAHALLREAAYATLTDADRVLGHRLAADHLEGAAERDPLLVALHRERAGERDAAVGWYLRAAEEALAANDLDGTIARAARGIACGAAGVALGELRLVAASAYNWKNLAPEAIEACADALRLLPRGSPRWLHAATVAAESSLNGAQVERLVELAGLLDEVPPGDDALPWCLAAQATARGLLYCGRLAEGRALLARCEAVAVGVSDPVLEASLPSTRSALAVFMGDVGASLAFEDEAARRFAALGHQRRASQLRANVGYAYYRQGAYEQAERIFTEVIPTAERMGLSGVVAMTQQNLGLVKLELGDLAAAEALVRPTTEAFEVSKNWRMIGVAHCYLASILRVAGRLEEAEAEARRAEDLSRRSTAAWLVARAALVNIVLACGRDEEALALAEEGMRRLEEVGAMEEREGLLRLCWARALARAGDPRARAAADEAKAWLAASAAHISDKTLHASYLERVPEHAAIRAL